MGRGRIKQGENENENPNGQKSIGWVSIHTWPNKRFNKYDTILMEK